MRWPNALQRRPRRRSARRVLLGALAVGLLGAGGVLLGGQLWLAAKARCAEILIADAFARHLADGQPHLPWQWADMHPIARLEIPRLGMRRFILSGGSGTSMAFGIGHIDGTAAPNDPGTCVLVGHRDTWCAFLRHLKVGDRLQLTTSDLSREYRVAELQIVAAEAVCQMAEADAVEMVLVTCYPFSGLLHSPWRYVVVCRPRCEAHG